MLEALSDIVKNVAIIILLTTFLDMLLPNTNMQRFIKVVMGLFIMLAILTPIIGLFKADYELSAWQLASLPEHKVETVLAQGEQIAKLQEKEALTEYENRIEKQIEALVKLVPNIADAKCTVVVEPVQKVGAIGKIEKAIVWLTLGEQLEKGLEVKPVKPVKVQIGVDQSQVKPSLNKDRYHQATAEKVINIISNYYNLPEKNIEVIFY